MCWTRTTNAPLDSRTETSLAFYRPTYLFFVFNLFLLNRTAPQTCLKLSAFQLKWCFFLLSNINFLWSLFSGPRWHVWLSNTMVQHSDNNSRPWQQTGAQNVAFMLPQIFINLFYIFYFHHWKHLCAAHHKNTTSPIHCVGIYNILLGSTVIKRCGCEPWSLVIKQNLSSSHHNNYLFSDLCSSELHLPSINNETTGWGVRLQIVHDIWMHWETWWMASLKKNYWAQVTHLYCSFSPKLRHILGFFFPHMLETKASIHTDLWLHYSPSQNHVSVQEQTANVWAFSIPVSCASLWMHSYHFVFWEGLCDSKPAAVLRS